MSNDQVHKPKVWLVRAKKGKLTGDFVSKGYVIGWEPRKVDMSSVGTRAEIEKIYRRLYPKDSNHRVGNIVSQLEIFLLKMQIGDYIITLGLNRDFFYGIVSSGLFFFEQETRPETRREVDWIGGPLRMDDPTSMTWYNRHNRRTVSEVKGTNHDGTNRRNEFFKLIGRDDLVGCA